jgi:hypothetical protein
VARYQKIIAAYASLKRRTGKRGMAARSTRSSAACN